MRPSCKLEETMQNKKLICTLTILGSLGLDQFSKHLILQRAADLPLKVSAYFNLVLTWNKGVSFGMFHTFSSPLFRFGLIGLIILILLYTLFLLKKEKTLLTVLAYSLILGGALGNLIDRFFWGKVLDFLDFHYISYHWPAFNVADTSIVIGGILYMFGFTKQRKNS